MTYRPKQMHSAYQMLVRLLDDPARYDAHFATYVRNPFITPCRTLPGVLIMHSFSASVVMAVTYGYDMNEGETFVTSMHRGADIVLRFSTPEITALCTAFPFSGCSASDLAVLPCLLIYVCHSQGISGVVSWNGVQV